MNKMDQALLTLSGHDFYMLVTCGAVVIDSLVQSGKRSFISQQIPKFRQVLFLIHDKKLLFG